MVPLLPQLTLDMSIEEIKDLVAQLSPRELLMLMDALEEQVETTAMMRSAETGFREWLEEGEEIYDTPA